MGPVKKDYVLMGGALVAGFVIFAYWKRRGSSGGDSEIVYDTAPLIPAGDYVNPGSSDNLEKDLTGDTITTNSEWAQKATTHLGNIGYDPKTVASAIGVFFQRKGLTPAEMDAVVAAVGQFGPPPQGGPWAIIAKPVDSGGPLGAVTNLRVTGVTRTTVSLAWDKVEGAARYQVELQGKEGGWNANFDTPITNFYTSSGLWPGKTYEFAVYAERGNENGPEATVTGTTSS
jgi:hypothetical protein